MSAAPISQALYGGSGAAGKLLQAIYFADTRSVTVQFDGLADVLVIGGHGSGGAVSIAAAGYVTGASTGEVAVAMRVAVKRGDVLAGTIGAGGTAVTVVGGRTPGVNGGDSSLVIGSRTIVAKGGRGALVGSALPLNGPRGGYGGSGGDLHIEGGPGGSVLATTSPIAAAGSGAVGLLLSDPSERAGGNVNSTAAAPSSAGAGVGGRGGHGMGNGSNWAATGGGYGGPGLDATLTASPSLGGGNALGQQQSASPTALVQALASIWGLDYFGGGAVRTGGFARGAGPGGGGSADAISGSGYSGAGAFGGPGGVAASNNVVAGSGSYGAGGSCVTSTASANATSTAGSPGLIVVMVREG